MSDSAYIDGNAVRGAGQGTGQGVGRAEASIVAYRRAVRHSGRVRFLKKAIPIGASSAIVLVVVVSVFDPFGRMSGLTLGPINLSGTRITMEQPRLSGFRKDSRPYEVTAISASQDIKKPNIIELKDLQARVTLEGANNARLEAATGIYDSQKETLQLVDNVRVRSSSGYDAVLKSAQVDFKAGTVTSREAVRVAIDGGTIEADTLDISDNGKRIVFEGRVRTVLESGRFQSGALAGDGSPR